MNRRDTIILSILVNAGLLMLLFATAIRSGGESKPSLPISTRAVESHVEEMEIAATHAEEPKQSDSLLLEDFLAAPAPSKAKEELVDEVVIQKKDLPKAVAVAPKPEPKPELDQSKHVQVTVKKGDFLEKIAKAHNTSVSAIMKANRMTSTNLKVGQVLQVPLSTVTKSSTNAAADSEYYVVKEGDNPWLIASKNRIRLDDLLKINGLDEAKARKLRPGDRLKIR